MSTIILLQVPNRLLFIRVFDFLVNVGKQELDTKKIKTPGMSNFLEFLLRGCTVLAV